MKKNALFIMMALALVFSCVRADDTVVSKAFVMLGKWGADGAEIVANNQKVTLIFNCATAEIPTQVMVDGNNQFLVKGTYTQQMGNSITGLSPEIQAVTFEGKIINNELDMTIKRSDDKTLIGTYKLVKDTAGKIVKCM